MAPALAEAPPVSGPAFTPEQRTAVEDRAGSRLLAANAGSGKTAVMVERFAGAVLEDDVAVGAILALTFTEKAAGELRERIRRRFAALGRPDLAREAEGAQIGTIHGFCARVLRSHPLAAGLDPRFEVLDELAAQRLASGAFERALDTLVQERGAQAVDLAAAYGPGLRDLVLHAHSALRSRGATRPRLKIPPTAPAPDPALLGAAAAAAARELATAVPGIRVGEGIAALEAGVALAGRGGDVPYPAELDDAKLGAQAAALKTEACVGYRDAWEAYRQACADHHARAVLVLVDALLDAFAGAYAGEGDAPLESEGLNAIRLMTIHRAKGLEFDVVCVADVGRDPARTRDPLLVGHDGEVGLRLSTLGGGKAVPALAYDRLAAELAEREGEEERRLFYVAMTRAREKLIVAGAIDAKRWPEAKAGAAPATWIARALLGDEPRRGALRRPPRRGARPPLGGPPVARARAAARARRGRRRPAGHAPPRRARRHRPAARADRLALGGSARPSPLEPAPARPRRRRRRARRGGGAAPRARPPLLLVARRLRALRLPLLPAPGARPARRPRAPAPPGRAGRRAGSRRPRPRVRGTLAHAARGPRLPPPRPAGPRQGPGARRVLGRAPTAEEVDDVIGLVAAFAESPLCARLAAAGRTVRREAPFAFALESRPDAPLLTGFIDVLATEPGGGMLVVDYKTDRLQPGDAPRAARRAGVRHAAPRLRARRQGRGPSAWRSPTATSSARPPRRAPPSRAPTRPRSPRRCSTSRRA